MSEIVPVHLIVEAMRDNGYSNTATALAELIDNSIQAGAKNVNVYCGESVRQQATRTRFHVEEIAVLDDGGGMTDPILIKALQFGNGTHLDAKEQRGIGKFGMGLPSSSISQCKRVEVYTWQKGLNSTIWSYLDVDEIRAESMKNVPEPIKKSIPEKWLKIIGKPKETGTLVIWTKIDRCLWKTAPAIIKNSEFLVGRMYRKFIDKKLVKIQMHSFDIDKLQIKDEMTVAIRPNDPGYLIEETSCPPPFSKKAMFEPDGEQWQETISIDYEGEEHEVVITFSVAKDEAKDPSTCGSLEPGATPHGKHALRNVGVSIVRANRELELQPTWAIQHDVTERWWGVEIEFPPSLDKLFGVTNNKQSARTLEEISTYDFEAECKLEKITEKQKLEHLKEDGDDRVHLITIAQIIEQRLKGIRKVLRSQRENVRTKSKTTAEELATIKTLERRSAGHIGESDKKEEQMSPEKRKEELVQNQVDSGESLERAKKDADYIFNNKLKYFFKIMEVDSPAFFSVEQVGGVIIIKFNRRHPAYEKFFSVMEQNVEVLEPKQIKEDFLKAQQAIKLMLAAWARYEDELNDAKREEAQQTRQDWGLYAKDFLK